MNSTVADCVLDHFMVMREPGGGVVEGSAKASTLFQVDQRHRPFDDPQTVMRCLHPKFERHGIAHFGEMQLGQGVDTIRFEATESIGELQTQQLVDFLGDPLIDPATRLGGWSGRLIDDQITTARDDIRSSLLMGGRSSG